MQGARRSYAVGLGPDDQLVLYKNDGAFGLVTAVDYPWQHGQSYEFNVRVKGSHLTASTGDIRIDWTDEFTPYLSGQIGFANFAGYHTRYERMEIGG